MDGYVSADPARELRQEIDRLKQRLDAAERDNARLRAALKVTAQLKTDSDEREVFRAYSAACAALEGKP